MAPMVKAACVAGVASIAFLLQGCYSDGSCMWPDDVHLKGCSWIFMYNWDKCVSNCNGCMDDCNKLKCLATCAKLSGSGECQASYKTLCDNSVSNVMAPAGMSCDVDCSAARPGAKPSWLLLMIFALVGLSQADLDLALPRFRLAPCLVAVLAFMALSLSGCCDLKPSLPSNWVQDVGELQVLAGHKAHGIWMGNHFASSLLYNPMPENEEHSCIADATGQDPGTNGSVNPTPAFTCGVWQKSETTCLESEFGRCYCTKRMGSSVACAEWTCKDLEADQHVCHFVYECNDHRRLDDLNVTAGATSLDVVEAEEKPQASILRRLRFRSSHSGGRRRGSCDWTKRCIWAPLKMDAAKYDEMARNEGNKFNKLSGSTRLIAFLAHDASIWGWMQTQALCIVPGDFTGTSAQQYQQQQQYCHGQAYFREIESEYSHCKCTVNAFEDAFCMKWHCTEIATGIFKVLFEKVGGLNIEDLLEGEENEDWSCVDADPRYCKAWEGTATSFKEVERARCECINTVAGATGSIVCSNWVCDEYELPMQFAWYWYPAIWAIFGILSWVMVFLAFVAKTKTAAGGPYCCILFLGIPVFIGIGFLGFIFVSVPPLAVGLAVVLFCSKSGRVADDEDYEAEALVSDVDSSYSS